MYNGGGMRGQGVVIVVGSHIKNTTARSYGNVFSNLGCRIIPRGTEEGEQQQQLVLLTRSHDLWLRNDGHDDKVEKVTENWNVLTVTDHAELFVVWRIAQRLEVDGSRGWWRGGRGLLVVRPLLRYCSRRQLLFPPTAAVVLTFGGAWPHSCAVLGGRIGHAAVSVAEDATDPARWLDHIFLEWNSRRTFRRHRRRATWWLYRTRSVLIDPMMVTSTHPITYWPLENQCDKI